MLLLGGFFMPKNSQFFAPLQLCFLTSNTANSVYSAYMGIDYTTTPKNYEELVDAVRGQVERTRELGMMGESIPYEESVTITSESFLGLLDRIESLSEMVTHQAHMFVHIENLFRWVFTQLGVDIDELADESDEG
jgi:hypothetical protein